MTQHVILGGGPAAINAIETIRAIDNGSSHVTLVCDEPAYARMALPYWLAGQVPERQVYTADDAYYDRLKVERRIGRRATRIDPKGNTVTIELQIEPGVILTGDGERPGVGETIAFLINDGQMLDGTVDDSIAWRVLNPEILHKHDVVQP